MKQQEYISFYRIEPKERMVSFFQIGKPVWRVIQPLDGSNPALDELMVMSLCFTEQGVGIWAESSYYNRRVYIEPEKSVEEFFKTEKAARQALERLENGGD